MAERASLFADVHLAGRKLGFALCRMVPGRLETVRQHEVADAVADALVELFKALESGRPELCECEECHARRMRDLEYERALGET
jgi:hypothetical protein